MVLNNPFDKNKEPLNHDIFERFFGHIDILKKRKEFVEGIKNEVMKDVEKNIKDLSPELLTNFNMIYQELTGMMKDFRVTVNSIEKKSKKLFESSTLTEDVYKMRDEVNKMKEATKYFDKIKKAFD